MWDTNHKALRISLFGVIYHDADFFATKQRKEAFKTTIKENYSNMQIVACEGIACPKERWGKVVSATLSKHQGLNGIFVVWAASFEGVLIVILIDYHEDRFGH